LEEEEKGAAALAFIVAQLGLEGLQGSLDGGDPWEVSLGCVAMDAGGARTDAKSGEASRPTHGRGLHFLPLVQWAC
jgi:hypothetical protein